VASRELKRDTVIQEEDLVERPFQAKGIPQDAMQAHEIHAVIGKRLRSDLQAGTLVYADALTGPVEPTLAKRLKPSLRAVTLQVDPVNAMSGLINPGDFIDLFVSFDHLGSRVTAPLLRSVEVLATDGYTSSEGTRKEPSEARFSTITVAVSSSDSIRLIAARQSGAISATMRTDASQNASGGSELGLVSLEQMLGLRQSDADEPIRIIYGDRLEGDMDILGMGATSPKEGVTGRLEAVR
jgi:pilus assembly protein CpaB